ncbi:hypothetical protein [Mesorhizobium sp. M1E.F.Ca.ET.063.01.1.1]|uniref:hypothetical protein n=1 Tax=Mesorhizobium sp. M1E.F.Ca.ET.063.01.1.1 TaxID=2496750 RepID=UPI001AECF73A|nr:hypothetical protein [Mesorhizobium sp. M1E.F.Ca.ET.063.01.1.1]
MARLLPRKAICEFRALRSGVAPGAVVAPTALAFLMAGPDGSRKQKLYRLTWIKAARVENPEMVPRAVIFRWNFEIGDLR